MPPIWLLTLVLKTGITGRFVKAAAWMLTVIAAIAIVIGFVMALQWAWDSHNDAIADEAVAGFGRDLSLDAANRVIEADRAASANASDATVIERKNEKELDDAVRNSNSPVVSVLERMREQQAAGRR